MIYRRFEETGAGWRITATRRDGDQAIYHVEPIAGTNVEPFNRWSATLLIEAINRARRAMGEDR